MRFNSVLALAAIIQAAVSAPLPMAPVDATGAASSVGDIAKFASDNPITTAGAIGVGAIVKGLDTGSKYAQGKATDKMKQTDENLAAARAAAGRTSPVTQNQLNRDINKIEAKNDEAKTRRIESYPFNPFSEYGVNSAATGPNKQSLDVKYRAQEAADPPSGPLPHQKAPTTGSKPPTTPPAAAQSGSGGGSGGNCKRQLTGSITCSPRPANTPANTPAKSGGVAKTPASNAIQNNSPTMTSQNTPKPQANKYQPVAKTAGARRTVRKSSTTTGNTRRLGFK